MNSGDKVSESTMPSPNKAVAMNRPTEIADRTSHSTAISGTGETSHVSNAAVLLALRQLERVDNGGLETYNMNRALLLNLESMRNHVTQPRFNLDYGGNMDTSNYGSGWARQQLLHQQQLLDQRRQHILEQHLLSQRLLQLQQYRALPGHQYQELNRYLGTHPYTLGPTLQMSSLPANVLPFQLPYSLSQQGNVSATGSSMNASLMQQGNPVGSSILSILNSIDGSGILGDLSLQHRQELPSQSRLENATGITSYTAEPSAATLVPAACDSTNNARSDPDDRGTNEEAPIRALSAYNFFFRFERERLLNSKEEDDGADFDLSQKNQWEMLNSYWNRDRSVKRRHRKSHGKISFSELSKKISKRWKSLSKEQKNFFYEVAAKDWERYQNEIKQQQKPNGR